MHNASIYFPTKNSVREAGLRDRGLAPSPSPLLCPALLPPSLLYLLQISLVMEEQHFHVDFLIHVVCTCQLKSGPDELRKHTLLTLTFCRAYNFLNITSFKSLTSNII